MDNRDSKEAGRSSGNERQRQPGCSPPLSAGMGSLGRKRWPCRVTKEVMLKLGGCFPQSWGKALRSAGGEKVQAELWQLAVLV